MKNINCPNCSKGVSEQAKISACPQCYHPFIRAEWQRKAEELERERQRREEESRRKFESEQAKIRAAERSSAVNRGSSYSQDWSSL